MSKATVIDQTSNQLHVDYDYSKIFVWSNRYDKGSLLNASGGVLSYSPGLVVARIAATNKVVPFDETGTDGSQIPIGILKTSVTDLADTAEKDVNFCISGDVVEGKITFITAATLDTVVTIGTGTENTRIVRDMIQSLGIKILPSTELNVADNS